MIGLEPITCWLQISCSANWATSACCNRIKPQKSHFHYLNDSKGIWTPVTAVKGRCLNRLTMEPYAFVFFDPFGTDLWSDDSNGNRTRVTAVKGRCLNRLTMEPQYLFSYEKTPRVGLEPTTTRLTAECSTIELSRKMSLRSKAI